MPDDDAAPPLFNFPHSRDFLSTTFEGESRSKHHFIVPLSLSASVRTVWISMLISKRSLHLRTEVVVPGTGGFSFFMVARPRSLESFT